MQIVLLIELLYQIKFDLYRLSITIFLLSDPMLKPPIIVRLDDSKKSNFYLDKSYQGTDNFLTIIFVFQNIF